MQQNDKLFECLIVDNFAGGGGASCGIELATGRKVDIALNHDRNHVATPRYVVEDIYKLIHIEQFSMVWFPFNNYDSQFKLKADDLKLRYKATHQFDDRANDFFSTLPPDGCELMISNPPFDRNLQNKVLARSFELYDKGFIKSFCLLEPLSTLETPERSILYERHESELAVIIFRKRIKFLGKDRCFNTACCWICCGVKTIHQKILWI